MPDSPAPSPRLASSRCPECGAPVDLRDLAPDQLQVKCRYCGTLIAAPERKPSPAHVGPATPRPTPPRAAPRVTVTSDGRAVKGGWGCGLSGWMTVSIVTIILAIVVFTELDTGTLRQSLGWTLVAPPRLVSAPIAPGGADQGVQLLMAAYEESSSRLVGFDPATRREVWRTPRLSDRWYELAVVGDAARVYVADGATLLAVARSDGAQVWQTSLATNLQTTCAADAPCLQWVRSAAGGEDGIVALLRDGTLQAFDADSGALRWSRRLNATPRRLQVVGDMVIVVDGDERNRAVVLGLDAQRGDPRLELRPACRPNDFDRAASPFDQYRLTPDRRSLIVAAGGHAACAWRYDLADGRETWRYVPDPASGARPAGAMPFAWATASLLVDNRELFVVNDQGQSAYLFALDTLAPDSPARLVYEADRYDLTLEQSLGNLLLLSARPTFARNEVELWALDPTTGTRAWQRPSIVTHPLDDWAARLTNQGLFVAACLWDESFCRFELLDPVTGVTRQTVRADAGRSYGGATWLGDTGYFIVGGKLYAVDPAAGRVLYSWP